MKSRKRIVVVGVGAVTAFGTGADEFWRGLADGRTGVRPVAGMDLSQHRTRLGAEVRRHPTLAGDPAFGFAVTAAREAMAQSGLWPGPGRGLRAGVPTVVESARWGVVIGTCNGGLRSAERAWRAETAGGVADWRDLLMIQPQIIAEALAAEFGLRGPVLSVNTACASGAHAIAHGWEMLRAERTDAVLVGGTDAFTETAFAGFNSLESLSPGTAAPYSRGRDGLNLGEGAGMLVLTTDAVAHGYASTVLAEVLGYGLSADGHHPTSPRPDGSGAARAITSALAHSGLDAHRVDYVNGHGTGTPKNDSAESNAVRLGLGDHAAETPLTSVKSAIGHTLGAAGAVEGIATALALRHQMAPPTVGFTEPDPGCGLDAIAGTGRPMTLDVALSNNFAFAGANATVVFGRPGRGDRDGAAEPPSSIRYPGSGNGGGSRDDGDDIVITGIGVLSPSGDDLAQIWNSYAAGEQPGSREHGLRVRRLSQAPTDGVTARQARRLDRLSLFAVAVCHRALRDAGVEPSDPDAERFGVVLGTGLGPVESLVSFTAPVLAEGPLAANPAVFPNTVYNAAAGHVAMLLGTRGPTSTITAAHAAGAGALAVAEDLMRGGHADTVICPAVDVLTPAALRGYAAIPLFAPTRAESFTLAEGGLALVLQRRSVARRRGARIHGRLAGHAIASDAAGVGRWNTHGEGLESAMRTAAASADLKPDDIRAVWANATGLPLVDRAEQAALDRFFGADGPTVHRPKLVLGEPVGAGAHQSAALAIARWADDRADAGPVLINSSSLGGTHVALVLTPEGA